jgi:viologen exporter family transport system permease protein
MRTSALFAGFKQGARSAAGDPSDLVGKSLFLVFILTVMAGLWRTALAAHGGMLSGYDLSSMGWYVFGAQAAVMIVPIRLIETLGDEIGDGTITVAMLRPVSVLGMRLALEAGAALVRLAALLPVCGAATWLLFGPPPNFAALPLAVVAIIAAGWLNLAAQHLFGAMAFWLRDAKAAWFLYQKIVFLPGGMLIPLELLPRGLASVCRWLPFAAMAYVPGRITSGDADYAALLEQGGWLLAVLTCTAAVYELGQRRLETVGG